MHCISVLNDTALMYKTSQLLQNLHSALFTWKNTFWDSASEQCDVGNACRLTHDRSMDNLKLCTPRKVKSLTSFIMTMMLIQTILSLHLVQIIFTVYSCRGVMIYNPTIQCHPEEIGFLSRFLSRAMSCHELLLATVTSGLLNKNLNLHPDFCKAALGQHTKKFRKDNRQVRH